MILLKHIIPLLQQLFDQLLVATAHGEVQRCGLVGLRLYLKQLSQLRTMKDVKERSADGFEQLMAELCWQFDDDLALGCFFPKPHQLEEYFIPVLLLVVLLYYFLDEDGEMGLGLQHSFARTDVDEVLEDVVGTVSAAGTETAEVNLLVHGHRVVVLSQFEQIQSLRFPCF